jgi:hypothetical protein
MLFLIVVIVKVIAIGQLKVSKEQEMYWSTDDNLRKLLRYSPFAIPSMTTN